METITPMSQNWDTNLFGHSHPDYDFLTEETSSVSFIYLVSVIQVISLEGQSETSQR